MSRAIRILLGPDGGRSLARALVVVAAIPAATGVAAVFYCRNVYGSYIQTGAIDVVTATLLFRYMLVDYVVCAALVVLLWRPALRFRLLTGGVVLLFAAVQFVQYRSAVSSDEFLTPAILEMGNLLEYSATPRVVTAFVVTSVVALVALWAFLRVLRIADLPDHARIRVVVLGLSVAAVMVVAPPRWREQVAEKRHGLRARSPVFELVVAVSRFARQSAPEPIEPGPGDLDAARSYGFEIRPERPTPVVKPFFYREPLPFRSTGPATAPNVVLLFIESLSADLLEPYGGPTGLTPHIADMARTSMRVDGYFNHTCWTMRALRGQLCSMYPTYDHETWRDSESKVRTGRTLCLPQVLRDRDYRSVYLSYAPKHENYMESQFIDFGFDETYFQTKLQVELLGNEADAGFPGDREMFRALVGYLERWEGSQPLFVALSTVQTHVGWSGDAEGLRFGDGSNNVLNVFHNLDGAFGLFWSWFKDSRYFENTLVILTADHTLWPHDMARRALPGTAIAHNLAPIALLIHDPTHDLPASYAAGTSSIDLAPSLVHLLGFEDRPNSFLGLSMFSDRRGFRGGPGFSEEGLQVLYWESNEPRVESVAGLECNTVTGRTHEACRVLRLVRYFQGLERSNRIWRQ